MAHQWRLFYHPSKQRVVWLRGVWVMGKEDFWCHKKFKWKKSQLTSCSHYSPSDSSNFLMTGSVVIHWDHPERCFLKMDHSSYIVFVPQRNDFIVNQASVHSSQLTTYVPYKWSINHVEHTVEKDLYYKHCPINTEDFAFSFLIRVKVQCYSTSKLFSSLGMISSNVFF